jgi:ankyrin repeat protein
VLTSDQYKAWLSSQKDDLLWVLADPGCGKSVLSRSLVDTELRRDLKTTICYFFFRDNEDQGKLSTALCSLLHQLFNQKPELLDQAIPTWEANKNTLQEDPDQLWELLLSAVTDPAAHSIYFVLDGVDECSENGRAQLLRYIKRFYSSSYQNIAREGNLKIILTSRPYADIESKIKYPNGNMPAIRLSGPRETEMVKEEINVVIKARMTDIAERVGIQQESKDRIESKMLSMHNRTYLWVQLVTEELEYNITRGEKVRSTDIDKLPTTVEAAYEKLLNRHTDSPRRYKEACIMLHIVAGAKRPMTLAEMDVAFNLATQENPTENLGLDDEFLDGNRLATRVRNLCGLFVFVSDERIHLIHQTAKDFLLSTQSQSPQRLIGVRFTAPELDIGAWRSSINIRDCDSLLALVCVVCLQLLEVETSVISVNGNNNKVRGLFQYSALFWGDHYRGAQSLDRIWLEVQAISLYHAAQKRTSLWYEEFKGIPSIDRVGPLAVASELGHEDSVKRLIDNGAEINPKNEPRSPLYSAIASGHEGVVRILLEQGANMNLTGLGVNPLISAAMMGFDHLVDLLLEHGASLDLELDRIYVGWRNCGDLALLLAASNGNLALFQRLFELRKMNPRLLNHALEVAASNGHTDVVRFLLSRGASCNPEPCLVSPLQKAALGGHIDTMQVLLTHGAAVNGRVGVVHLAFPSIDAPKIRSLALVRKFGTRIMEAGHSSITRRIDAIMQILSFNATRTPSSIFSMYPPPLIIAVAKGNMEMVNLLLGHGAAANANYLFPKGNEFLTDVLYMFHDENLLRKVMYHTPLVAAMKTRQFKLAANLMKRGGNSGREILPPDVQTEAVRWFVDNEAEIEYATWVKRALRLGQTGVAAMILELRPMVASDLGPFLPELAENKQHDSVKLLLHHGVDPNTRGTKFNKIALHWAAEKGQEETVKLLLEIGSNPNLLDEYGQTPLHYAAEQGFEGVVRDLLNVTDVTVVDTKGRTALRCAQDRNQINVVKLLDPSDNDGAS